MTGRPSSYREEYNEQAYKLCLLGATDKEMADFFGVSEQTLNAWKKSHPIFLESLKRGKDEADSNVAQRLYQRAIGVKVREVKMSGGGDDESPSAVETIKELPPDTTAAIFWLKNRRKAEWRDKQDHEHTGKDGGPIKTESKLDLSDLSPDERDSIRTILSRRSKQS